MSSQDKDLKVENLALRDLQPCGFCGGSIVPLFYLVDIRVGAVNTDARREFASMHTYFNEKAPALAELFTPHANEAAQVLDDREAGDRVFLCQTCAVDGLVDLRLAAERFREKAAARQARESASG